MSPLLQSDVDYTNEISAVDAKNNHVLRELSALNDMGSIDALSIGATTMNSIMSRLSNYITKDKSGVYAELTWREFLRRYYWPLLLCSITWFISNAVFVGLLILLEPVAKYIGFNAQLNGETAADECFGLSLTYLTLCLVPLIPGATISPNPQYT